ncbi:uncharacterized protein LOC125764346 [Anopheles funestus]|uniref:uncharacterized protein LOC125764346 n=1 Tax=Anopheles funestus TaxID=62324 RepID=UPI0020C66C77|nr:uncharacterized protein LOC125764346 [Anopheles funestus]
MHSLKGHRLIIVGTVLITLELQFFLCQPTTPDLRQRESKARIDQLQTKSMLHTIDSKAKLDGLNRALYEQLQHSRANLRPLQARATQLQHHFDAFQRTARRATADPARKRNARNELLQEAQRFRAAVERKLQSFGPVDQHYRNMRTVLQSKSKNAVLPSGWVDRDTERQMELNERIYKNIINLLVQLIECPVNIIHDVMGPSVTTVTTLLPPESPTDNGVEDEDDGTTEGNTYYDEREPIELNQDVNALPWLEGFHY